MKTEECDYAVRPDGYNIRHQREDDYHEGAVATEHGYVLVYAQGSATDHRFTSLRFIRDGRCYVRRLPRRYTPRGLVTLAARFAAEIVENKQ